MNEMHNLETEIDMLLGKHTLGIVVDSVEETYTKRMVNNGAYFENASVSGEVPMRFTAGAGFIDEIEMDEEAITLAGQKAIAYDLIISCLCA